MLQPDGRTVTVTKSIDRAQICVTSVFAIHALDFSSWVAHIPHVKSELRLSDGALGNALLGALIATALCIRLLPRWGSHILVLLTIAGYAASGPLLGCGDRASRQPWTEIRAAAAQAETPQRIFAAAGTRKAAARTSPLLADSLPRRRLTRMANRPRCGQLD